MENYQFIKQIGQGRYSEIWLVKCSKTRKKHVLKRIDLRHVSKREQRTTHLEAKLLSTIKHPNIVTYLDSFHDSFGSLFIVMNYCECGDLYTFIRNQNGMHFEEKQIVHWFVQICLALKYLHDKNILHRDLKTRNIFLTKNKILKVGDLGISKVLSIANEMTATLIEMPYYVSPEIFSGESFSNKSDIWALGCCTYEITTLKHPFIAQDIPSLLQKITKGQLPSIPKMYSSDLYDIITAMLDEKPENRPCVTELLLNDYIRRYILLILQDDSKSPDSEASENSDGSPMERSKSNSDLSLAISKDGSNGIQRSMSTCFLPRSRSKNSGAASKAKKKYTKPTIITVPDVNGNGDGNDNSQHRRMVNARKKTDYDDDDDDCRSKVSVESKNFLKVDWDSRKTVSQRSTASSSTVSSSYSLKQSELSSYEQKMKSEISFQILNNLAYSLHTARLQSFKDSSRYVSSENSDFGHSDTSMCAKSPAVNGVEKPSSHSIKASKNMHESDKPMPRKEMCSNVCTLPQIKQEARSKKVSKSLDHTKNLPHMKFTNFK